MGDRLLLVGLSTRAAAEAAARAGFTVTALDAFADLDQHPAVDARLVPRAFGPRAAMRAGSRMACDAVAYLSPFENHPDCVAALAAGRRLLGNSPAVLRQVRDPQALAEAAAHHGFTVPRLGGDGPGPWLMKPLKSGGGHGIRPWRPGARLRLRHYVQERIEGLAASFTFVANGRDAVLLAVSRQLSGLAAFGAPPFAYCGNVLDPVLTTDPGLAATAGALVSALTREFGLVGLNGIDVIISGRVPYLLEVNPRWSASMELIDRVHGTSIFDWHAHACADGALPAAAPVTGAGPAVGKAVIYAREDVVAGDTRSWLADSSVRDVPRPGERIAAGRPICTVFAAGADAGACLAALEARAAAVYAALQRAVQCA